MEKINIAEILKDCPSGMELDCVMYDNVSFDKVSDDKKAPYPIFCYITDEKGNRSGISFTENGYESRRYGAKCVIFPKGKTTWEGFQIPFKDGDVVFYDGNIAIFKEWGDETLFRTYVTKYLCCDSLIDKNVPLFGKYIRKHTRFATEEEKAKLFQAIKDKGYKWNAETKTLEKLLKFKVGDRIKSIISQTVFTITDIRKDCYIICGETDKFGYHIPFSNQNNYELVPNKFDISTLKPFDEVLVRDNCQNYWVANLYSHYMKASRDYPFATVFGYYRQCIPYEGNEHLLGTTNDCDDFYKTWE